MSRWQLLVRHGVATNRRMRTMTANDLFAVAPDLMKKWAAVSLVARFEPGTRSQQTRGNPCLPDQRLRQLHQYAHRGGAREGRNRAAHLSAVGLARSPVLFRSRTRCARLDRGADTALRRVFA